MKKLLLFMSIAVIASLFTSCGPYQEKVFVEIASNETAFVIPMEAQNKNGQKQFSSEKYLDSMKVATKRIYIPTKSISTGRMWWSYEYIEVDKVIKVNRSPVTREWTINDGTGTKGNKKEDIEVESKESIAFGQGITATATIPEKWAAKFLYSYSGKSLAKVMDEDVRAYIQSVLSSEFGIRDLTTCQAERKEVFAIMIEMTKKHFASFGVEIMQLGAAGGFTYKDAKIQNSINDQFASEKKVLSAQNEVDAANKFLEAKNAIEQQKMLDATIDLMGAQADFLRGVGKGKVKLPTNYTVLPEGAILPNFKVNK